MEMHGERNVPEKYVRVIQDIAQSLSNNGVQCSFKAKTAEEREC